MKVLSLVNQKGGVGKTMTAMALADGFARRGKKVLLIDFDPQAHLTNSFGLVDAQPEYPEALRLLGLGKCDSARERVISNNLSIITSDIGLERANNALVGRPGPERHLARALARFRDLYDYIIIDSNPSLSQTTLNVMYASDYLLIPFKPEFNSLRGIDLLYGIISDVKELKPSVSVLGFIATMKDSRRSSTPQAIAYVKQVADSWGSKIYASEIRIGVACADAPSHGKTLFEYDPDSNVSQDYEKLCDEILTELEEVA